MKILKLTGSILPLLPRAFMTCMRINLPYIYSYTRGFSGSVTLKCNQSTKLHGTESILRNQ